MPQLIGARDQDGPELVDERTPEIARIPPQHLVSPLAGQRDLYVAGGAATEVPERQHRAVGERLLQRVQDRMQLVEVGGPDVDPDVLVAGEARALRRVRRLVAPVGRREADRESLE